MTEPNYGVKFSFSGLCQNYNGMQNCPHVGWQIDNDYYNGGYASFVWNYTSNKTAIGIYDCTFGVNFDCGADGVLKNPDDASILEEYRHVDGYQTFDFDITAECVPNTGKKFVGWKKLYYNNSSIYKVGDSYRWADFPYEHGVSFIAVYEDVE
jgi:hypothetical protein